MHAVHLGIALEAGGYQHGVVGLAIVGQLLLVGADQQLMNKQVLAGQLVDDAEFLGILAVGACHTVKNKHLTALQIRSNLALDGVELFAADGAVHLAPGDLVVYALGVNDELIVRRTAGVLAGGHHQCAGVAQSAFAAAQGSLNQLCRGEIAIDCFGADNAHFFNAVSFHWYTSRLYYEEFYIGSYPYNSRLFYIKQRLV